MMARVIYADTNEILGKKVPWKRLPFHVRMLFQPFKKKNTLMYFRDFSRSNVYGCIPKEKGVVLE